MKNPVEVHIATARPTVDEVQPVVIHIVNPIPEIDYSTVSLSELNSDLQFDADKLFEALKNSLPQGVMDRLLVRILDWKKSSFVVGINAWSGEDK